MACRITLEPQEQGIAAELEQAASVLVGDEQDRLETLLDGLGDLLGALAALAGEALGELRESGDVHEYRSTVCGPARAGWVIDQMLLQDARYVANGALGVGFGIRRTLGPRRLGLSSGRPVANCVSRFGWLGGLGVHCVG